MATKKSKPTKSTKNYHLANYESFQFALNAAVLAVLISVILTMVSQATQPVRYQGKAAEPLAPVVNR